MKVSRDADPEAVVDYLRRCGYGAMVRRYLELNMLSNDDSPAMSGPEARQFRQDLWARVGSDVAGLDDE